MSEGNAALIAALDAEYEPFILDSTMTPYSYCPSYVGALLTYSMTSKSVYA